MSGAGRGDVQRAAEWLCEHERHFNGFQVQLTSSLNLNSWQKMDKNHELVTININFVPALRRTGIKYRIQMESCCMFSFCLRNRISLKQRTLPLILRPAELKPGCTMVESILSNTCKCLSLFRLLSLRSAEC